MLSRRSTHPAPYGTITSVDESLAGQAHPIPWAMQITRHGRDGAMPERKADGCHTSTYSRESLRCELLNRGLDTRNYRAQSTHT